METKQEPRKIPRRSFLRAAGLTAGAAGVAAVATAVPVNAAAPARHASAPGRYRLTEHIRKYYDLAKNY